MGQSLAQGHFQTEKSIFKPNKTFLHLFTFHNSTNTTLTYRARLRLCRRTGSTVRTTEITYIFLCIRFTCTSCVSIKHLKRIRFTCTSCVQLNPKRPAYRSTKHSKRCPLSVYAPLARLTVRLNSLIRIRITYTFNVAVPLACPFNPLYLYV